uniref:Uncharacterized protein n=1 Tax=Glossina austeni TaxID=7395 RepID=A0A1A9VYT7_GLOAU
MDISAQYAMSDRSAGTLWMDYDYSHSNIPRVIIQNALVTHFPALRSPRNQKYKCDFSCSYYDLDPRNPYKTHLYTLITSNAANVLSKTLVENLERTKCENTADTADLVEKWKLQYVKNLENATVFYNTPCSYVECEINWNGINLFKNTASLMVLANPGVVCILTLVASNGAKAMSAKNSAEAEAAKYNVVRYKYAFSSPKALE